MGPSSDRDREQTPRNARAEGPATPGEALSTNLPDLIPSLGSAALPPPPGVGVYLPSESAMAQDLKARIDYAAAFCSRRAGTGNRASTRKLASCIEHDEGDKVLAALVRRAHKNPRLEQGIRLLFVEESLNEAAIKYGVEPLKIGANGAGPALPPLPQVAVPYTAAIYPDKHSKGEWEADGLMVYAPGFRVADLTPNEEDLDEEGPDDEYSPETLEMLEANVRLVTASDRMKKLLVEAVSYEAEAFADGSEVSGADLVDFFARWREDVHTLLSSVSHGPAVTDQTV